MALQKPRQIEAAHHETLITLAPGLQLDVNDIIGQQLAAFGMPGFGKTNAVALLCEQIGAYSVPMAVFDKEGDYLSMAGVLPRGVIAMRDNCPTGRDILNNGLQVVYDLSTWDSLESAAQMIAAVVSELMAWASARPSHERVPTLIVMDEAHTWLPERRGTAFSKETYKTLFDAFQLVGSTGRKRGLTPFFACPKISELNKGVLYPGMYMFFRATLHTDVTRYLEYVHSSKYTLKGLREVIESLPRGKAIVKLPSGGSASVKFHKRQSEHTSHTPTVQAALNRYSAMPFNPDASYGMDMPISEQAGHTSEPEQVHVYPVKPVSAYQQCEILLKKNPLLTAEELHQMTGGTIGLDTIANYRRQLVAHLRNSYGAIHARVLAVLAVDPDISDTDLAKHANCTVEQARLHRSEAQS